MAAGQGSRLIRFSVTSPDVDRRVDVVVAERTGVPRVAVQRALRSGAVTLSGRAVRPSERVSEGDVVEGVVGSGDRRPPQAEAISLRVRYSDERVLVVSKPAGLVVHPAHGHDSGTLVNALLALGEPLSSVDPARPGIVHRLDKDTSGLLLVAKDDDAHHFLTSAMKRRLITRRYWALVRGHPAASTGTIDAPIGRDPRRRWSMAVVGSGKPAVTHYRALSSNDLVALLEVSLESGRTHQVRVHLAHAGHPVVGDPVYGGSSTIASDLGLSRPFLHAHALLFPHPDGSTVSVDDPLPDDLVAALARAGLAPP
jgi:23S rRNA pseudouridine1911/1915/1917 synthase